jgi:ATP-dependent DNA ligase
MASPRAAKRQLKLPTVEPIIPVERPTAWNDADWLWEPKHDGFRGLVYITPEGCTIRSKRGHSFRRFQGLCGQLGELAAARTAVLDGEVLAVDAEGRPRFMASSGASAGWCTPRSTCSGSMGETCDRCRS